MMMKDKDLIKELNSLNSVKPDQSWKEANRDILFSQISNTQALDSTENFSFSLFFEKLTHSIKHPVLSLALVVLLVTVGGFTNFNIFEDSRPGDSLYIAKKISEKTQQAFTFNQKKKAQLSVQFVENRVKELESILADEENQDRQDRVARLTNDIKEEIKHVKTRIEKISSDQEEDKDSAQDEMMDEEDPIFSANLGKGDDGISVSEDDDLVVEENGINEVVEENIISLEFEDSVSKNTDVSSSSEEDIDIDNNDSATSSEELLETSNHDQLLNEVKELIEMDNFDKTIEKLDEMADNFSSENGEVKGEYEEYEEDVIEESATSTIE